ncbi:MAK10-like protein [Tanacetum coccineum]
MISLIYNNIMMQSYIRSMNLFQGLTTKSPSSWHRPLAPSPNFYDHVNPVTRRTIDQSAGVKLRDRNAKESWALLEDSPLMKRKLEWTPRNFPFVGLRILAYDEGEVSGILVSRAKQSWLTPIIHMEKSVTKTLVLSARSYMTIDPQCSSHPSTLINAIKAHFKEATISQTSLRQPEIGIEPQQPEEPKPTLEGWDSKLGDSISFDTLADLGSGINIIPLYLFKKLNIRLLEETSHIFGLADGTKSYPVGIVKDIEVHIRKLKLLNDFYMIDMKKDPETPLLVGRGFLATANAVIDYRMAKIAVGEGITRSVFRVKGVDLDGIGARTPYYARKDFLDCHLPREWEIARDAELNPFKDTLVFRRMVELLAAIPINLKSNIDGAGRQELGLIDPEGEEVYKTLTVNPTVGESSLKENVYGKSSHGTFYDVLEVTASSLSYKTSK